MVLAAISLLCWQNTRANFALYPQRPAAYNAAQSWSTGMRIGVGTAA
jgi:hypothetical protein